MAGWLRAHSRGVIVGLLAGVGTPAGIIAGWASEDDRAWWLIGAGTCAGLAGVLSILPPRRRTYDGALDGRRWTIPPPVQSFTGRRELLLTLRKQLTRKGATALVPTTSLYGLGGVGKTQLALAYAQKYRSKYELGWWIPAESSVSITTAFATLAVALGMSSDLSPRELAEGARELLAERTRWLLVFDNATDPTLVAQFLPGVGSRHDLPLVARFVPAAENRHVLVTSRNPAWQAIADQLPVDVLPLDDAVELLLKRSGDSDRQAAESLAAELGQLPLALEQAAAYTGQNLADDQRPLDHYLDLFRNRHTDLLTRGKPLAYSGTVDATFTLTVDQLRFRNLAAVALLEVCALLAAYDIPVQLLLSRPEYLPTAIEPLAHDPLYRKEIVATLVEAGLLTRSNKSGLARTHRIIQLVTVAHLSSTERRERIMQTAELLAVLFPEEGWLPGEQMHSTQLLPHARMLLGHAADEDLVTLAVANLLMKVGDYLWGSWLALGEARDLHRYALDINRRLYQGDHPHVADSINRLAADLRRVGELAEAKKLDLQALKMRRRLYQGDHPDIARSFSNLAADLRRLGEVDEARELDLQALEIRRRLHQGDHPDIARSLFGLAMDLRPGEEEVDRARELDVQALEMRRRLYHDDHPAIAYSISNLAVDFHVLGDWEQAQLLGTEALEMCRRLYTGDHPDVATNLSNLASALYMQEEFEQARRLDTEALKMRQRLYKRDHPDIAESLRNLAVDMRALGKQGQAQELRSQESAMYERLYNADQDGRTHSSRGTDATMHFLWTGRWVRAFDD